MSLWKRGLALVIIVMAGSVFVSLKSYLRFYELSTIRVQKIRAESLPGDVWSGNGSVTKSSDTASTCFSAHFENELLCTNVVLSSEIEGVAFNCGCIHVQTTPIIKGFSYKRSVFYILEAEKTHYPSFFEIMFMSERLFESMLENLSYKISTGNENTRFHEIRNGSMVGCAYLNDVDGLALLTFDSGLTNMCVSIHLKWDGDIDLSEMEQICKKVAFSSFFNEGAEPPCVK